MMQDISETARAAEPTGVQAISRAAALLYALEDAPEGMSLSELAAAVGLPRSTVHRLARALAREDLLQTSTAGGIRLGSGIARLGGAARSAIQVTVRPVLVSLRDEIGETVDLAVLEGARVRFVDQLSADHRLRAVSSVGADFPAHCTANGKAMLAALAPETVRGLLPDRLPLETQNTIANLDELIEELDTVRAAGVAFDREEHSLGIWAVGAPITDASGLPVGALSVPVPTARLDGREKSLAAAVRGAAARASALIGG